MSYNFEGKEGVKLLHIWLYHVELYVGLVLTVCLHNLSEAGTSRQESHRKENV